MAMAVEIRYSGQTVEVRSASQKVDVQSAAHTVDVASVVMTGGIQYRGDYNIRPQPHAQTLPTEGKTLTNNIVVEPIPSNYGLITWDGSKLMVS